MNLNLKKIGIDVEDFKAIHPASDARRERRSGSGSGLPASPPQPCAKTMPDHAYEVWMEERYAIREEGIF